jgi:hypothetical protein
LFEIISFCIAWYSASFSWSGCLERNLVTRHMELSVLASCTWCSTKGAGFLQRDLLAVVWSKLHLMILWTSRKGRVSSKNLLARRMGFPVSPGISTLHESGGFLQECACSSYEAWWKGICTTLKYKFLKWLLDLIVNDV